MIMSRHRGFTLIELLVVIAIIALLMSIMMPAIQLVRQQTKALLCVSNLRQWGVLFMMYADENNGLFFSGGYGGRGFAWFGRMRPYYPEQGNIMLCPMTKPAWEWNDDHTDTYQARAVSPFSAWGIFGSVSSNSWYKVGDYGSYGMNNWACWEEVDRGTARPAAEHWQGPFVKGAGDIPLLTGNMTRGFSPRGFHATGDIDAPPDYDGQPRDAGNVREMNYCTFNRHNKHINMVFLDGSARKVGLKESWKLKWHRSFVRNNMYTTAYYGGDRAACATVWDAAALWMKDMREY